MVGSGRLGIVSVVSRPSFSWAEMNWNSSKLPDSNIHATISHPGCANILLVISEAERPLVDRLLML
jgi:hypothetical protein